MHILRSVRVLSVMAGAACFGTGCMGDSSSAPEEGRAAAASFLDDIRVGRVEPAWRATTVEFKSLMGLDSLKDYIRSHPALKGQAEYIEGRPVQAGGADLAEYRFRASAPPPPKGRGKPKPVRSTPSTIRVTTAREAGALKVERLVLE